tara:strand:- start:10 stop:258 length:249 start_codon:yes stop_codon:yes gene_type:complete
MINKFTRKREMMRGREEKSKRRREKERKRGENRREDKDESGERVKRFPPWRGQFDSSRSLYLIRELIVIFVHNIAALQDIHT